MSWLFRETQHAKLYLKFRPVYPREVFETIYDRLSHGNKSAHQWRLAIDVGCGSGQSTLPLCAHFEKVIGIDGSAAQIEEAKHHLADELKEKVTYRVGDAHDFSFQPDSSVDLITVAQALHWLDVGKFCKESLRVLRTGGVLAAFGYGTVQLQNVDGDQIVMQFYNETLDGYWDDRRHHIDDLYSDLYKSFATVFKHSRRVDTFAIENVLTVDEFMGYLSTWSGYQQYMKKNNNAPDPLLDVEQRLKSVFANESAEKPVLVRYPVFLLLGQRTE